MRKDISHLEVYRHTKEGTAMATKEGDRFGVFYIPQGVDALIAIFDDGNVPGRAWEDSWEKLSVRVKTGRGRDRVPNHSELNWLKNQFWEDDECVMSLWVPKSEHRNANPFTVDLWRPIGIEIPRPRKELA